MGEGGGSGVGSRFSFFYLHAIHMVSCILQSKVVYVTIPVVLFLSFPPIFMKGDNFTLSLLPRHKKVKA